MNISVKMVFQLSLAMIFHSRVFLGLLMSALKVLCCILLGCPCFTLKNVFITIWAFKKMAFASL